MMNLEKKLMKLLKSKNKSQDSHHLIHSENEVPFYLTSLKIMLSSQ